MNIRIEATNHPPLLLDEKYCLVPLFVRMYSKRCGGVPLLKALTGYRCFQGPIMYPIGIKTQSKGTKGVPLMVPPQQQEVQFGTVVFFVFF